jgi:hypothetical protein
MGSCHESFSFLSNWNRVPARLDIYIFKTAPLVILKLYLHRPLKINWRLTQKCSETVVIRVSCAETGYYGDSDTAITSSAVLLDSCGVATVKGTKQTLTQLEHKCCAVSKDDCAVSYCSRICGTYSAEVLNFFVALGPHSTHGL